MSEQASFTVTVTRGMTKRFVNPETNAVTWRPDGTETADIVLTVDADAVAKLIGFRAMSSRSKKSTLGHGAIIARATNIRRKGLGT